MSSLLVHLLAGTAWLGAWVGIALVRGGAGLALPLTPVLASAVAICLAVLLVLLATRPGSSGPASGTRAHPRARLVGAVAMTALVAGVGGAARATAITAGPLAAAVTDPAVTALAETDAGVTDDADGRGRAVRLTGRVDGDAGQRDGRWQVPVTISEVTVAGQPTVGSSERVLLRTGDDEPPAMGSAVLLRGVATPVPAAAAGWRFTQRIAVEVRSVEVTVVGAPAWWIATTSHLRDRTAEAAARHLPVERSSLLSGLVVGDTSQQPAALADAMRASGLSHLVAVSGSNVALVVGGVVGLLLLLGAGRRPATGVALLATWWFVVLVRAEPSVVRAAVLATLVAGAVLVGRVRHGRHLLASAVLLALLADPLLAVTLGFALSVAATAGVLWLAPPLVARLPGPRPLVVTLGATVGAQVAVAPVLLAVGGQVGLSAVPANLVAIPAAAVASTLGVTAALLAPVSLPAAAVVAGLAGPALGMVTWPAATFAGPTGQAVDRALPALVLVLAAWSAGRWLRAQEDPRLRRVGRLAGPVVLGLLVLLLRSPPAAPPVLTPQVVVLDVGQGDAVLVGDPSAGWMLVDGGPDPGRLRSALRRHGVDRLAAVVVSHPHDDHDAGLEGLLGHLPVAMVVVGPPAGDPPTSPLVAQATAAGVPVHRVHAGMGWRHGTIAVRVVSPPARGIADDANESSVVLRLDADAGGSALLTGDAEVIAQTRLLGDPAIVDVDLLKVPHHGGATNADGFLAATTPTTAVISAGQGNPFGHPHPDVLADLAGVDVRRTDLAGDVTVPLERGR